MGFASGIWLVVQGGVNSTHTQIGKVDPSRLAVPGITYRNAVGQSPGVDLNGFVVESPHGGDEPKVGQGGGPMLTEAAKPVLPGPIRSHAARTWVSGLSAIGIVLVVALVLRGPSSKVDTTPDNVGAAAVSSETAIKVANEVTGDAVRGVIPMANIVTLAPEDDARDLVGRSVWVVHFTNLKIKSDSGPITADGVAADGGEIHDVFVYVDVVTGAWLFSRWE